jgi:hypothetical protein
VEAGAVGRRLEAGAAGRRQAIGIVEAASDRRCGEARRVGRSSGGQRRASRGIDDERDQEEARAAGDKCNQKEAEVISTSKGMRLELGRWMRLDWVRWGILLDGLLCLI